MKDKNTEKKSKFSKKQIFYAVLTLCICASSAVSYYAMHKVRHPIQSTAPTEPPVTVLVTVPVNDIKEDIPDTRPQPTEKQTEIEEPSTEATIERAASFMPPMETEIVKEFSNGELVQSKTMGDWRTHNGVDYKGTVGDPVKSINNGIVRAVYDDVLWGTVVEIDYGEGLTAKYCGLGKGSTVEVGVPIKINEKIGNLGAIPAEAADEVHLHLELYQEEKLIDPMSVLG